MDLKLAQLRNFVDVAETCSFGAAAARAFRSQPAISLSLKALEKQLGSRMLESGKPVTLTPFGEQFLPLARQLLAHHDRVVLDVSAIAKGGQGGISVATVASVATYWIPTIIRGFYASHPEVLVSAIDDTSRKVQELVGNGQIDIGIGSIARNAPDVAFEPLMTDHFGLVCRRDHPLGDSDKPISWQQLKGLEIIGNSTHALLEGHKMFSLVRAPRVVMTTLTSLVANVRGGVGVTVLPKLGVPAESNLSFRLLVRPQVPRTLGILTRKGRTLSPQGNAFCQAIRDSLKTSG
jgi:DNA-binding transcriptional LysR family regulator